MSGLPSIDRVRYCLHSIIEGWGFVKFALLRYKQNDSKFAHLKGSLLWYSSQIPPSWSDFTLWPHLAPIRPDYHSLQINCGWEAGATLAQFCVVQSKPKLKMSYLNSSSAMIQVSLEHSTTRWMPAAYLFLLRRRKYKKDWLLFSLFMSLFSSWCESWQIHNDCEQFCSWNKM